MVVGLAVVVVVVETVVAAVVGLGISEKIFYKYMYFNSFDFDCSYKVNLKYSFFINAFIKLQSIERLWSCHWQHKSMRNSCQNYFAILMIIRTIPK